MCTAVNHWRRPEAPRHGEEDLTMPFDAYNNDPACTIKYHLQTRKYTVRVYIIVFRILLFVSDRHRYLYLSIKMVIGFAPQISEALVLASPTPGCKNTQFFQISLIWVFFHVWIYWNIWSKPSVAVVIVILLSSLYHYYLYYYYIHIMALTPPQTPPIKL